MITMEHRYCRVTIKLESNDRIMVSLNKKSKTKGNFMLLFMGIKIQEILSDHNKKKSNISAVHLIHDNLLSSRIYRMMAVKFVLEMFQTKSR